MKARRRCIDPGNLALVTAAPRRGIPIIGRLRV
jgi:hypothetical protein